MAYPTRRVYNFVILTEKAIAMFLTISALRSQLPVQIAA
jgi:hypothetical protein